MTQQGQAPAFDMEADAAAMEAAGPNDQQLKTITNLAMHQMALEDTLARQELELAETKKKLQKVTETDLPNAMAEANMKDFTLTSGAKITLKDVVRAHISEERKDAAFSWLKAHKAGSLIKNDVTLVFGSGQDKLARKFMRDLARRKVAIPFKQKVHVHTGALTAYVKEQLANGVNLPLDTFGVYQGKESKVTRPKTKED